MIRIRSAACLGVYTTLLWLIAQALPAQSPIGPVLQLTSSNLFHHNGPQVTILEDGSAVVTWQEAADLGLDPTLRFDLVADRYAPDGQHLWKRALLTRFGDESAIGSTQLIAEPDGFALFWDETFRDHGDPDGAAEIVFGRRFGLDATPRGETFSVTPTSGTQNAGFGGAARLPNGDYLVITGELEWLPGPAAYADHIYARVMKPSGQPRSPYPRIGRRGPYLSRMGGIGVTSKGVSLVAWSEHPPDLLPHLAFARWISPAGKPLGTPFRLLEETFDNTPQLKLTVAPDDTFMMVWNAPGDGYLNGIFARRFDADARPLGPKFRVNAKNRGDEYAPTVVTDRAGNLLVGWTVDPCYAFARLYRKDGQPVSGDLNLTGRVKCDFRPSLAFGSDGTFVAVGSTSNGDTDDVWMARFSASPADEPCLVRGGQVRCDTGRTGGPAENVIELGIPAGGTALFGDYDKDGREDLCVAAAGQFSCDLDHRGAPFEVTVTFGAPGETPLLGDLDGDGRAEACTWNGERFRCDTAHDGGAAETEVIFGAPGDTPLLGDLDGDGDDDPCVWRAGRILCDLRHDGGSAELDLTFGATNGLPALGDYDGDGDDDPCVLASRVLHCDLAHNGGTAEAELPLATRFGDRLLFGNLDGL